MSSSCRSFGGKQQRLSSSEHAVDPGGTETGEYQQDMKNSVGMGEDPSRAGVETDIFARGERSCPPTTPCSNLTKLVSNIFAAKIFVCATIIFKILIQFSRAFILFFCFLKNNSVQKQKIAAQM